MMKTYLLSLFIGILQIGCSDGDEMENIQNSCTYIGFKYYNGTEDYLGEMSNEFILIGIDTAVSYDEIQDYISRVDVIDQSYTYLMYTSGQYKFREIPLKLNTPKTCEEITQIISDLNQDAIISYTHFTMDTDDCDDLIGEPVGNLCVNSYGSSFSVKVFDENDLSDLNHIISETNTELVGQNQFMTEWFELRATKVSSGDGLAMANYFHESGLFEYSEPGISKYPLE